MDTVQGLAALAASLPTNYNDIAAVASLGAVARAQGGREKVGVLANNNAGKSSICDLLILTTLPREEACADTADHEEPAQPAPLAASRLVLDLHAEQAAQTGPAGQFVQVINPEPTAHAEHLKLAYNRYDGYFRNDRSNLSRLPTVLLPVGSLNGSTTQVATHITYDEVTACCIQPRNVQQLKGMAAESLESMYKIVEDEKCEDYELLSNQEFKMHADLFKQLTGWDWEERGEGADASLKGAVIKLYCQLSRVGSDGGSMLRDELASIAAVLKPVVLVGAQQNLSSDLWFVREALHLPRSVLLHSCGVMDGALPQAEDLTDDDARALDGLLIDHIDVTVPCRLLGSMELVDMPGLDDTRPLVNIAISQALRTVEHVMLITPKNLTTTLTLLNYLAGKTDWMVRQLTEGAHGSLVVLHYPEPTALLKPQDFWTGKLDKDAQQNLRLSQKQLCMLVKATLSGSASTAEEKAARVDSFLKSRTQLLTVFPANFCALGLASPADVVGALERDGVALPPRLTHQQVVSKLTLATNMHTCFQVLGSLSRFRSQQQLAAMRAEVQRIQAALMPAGPDAGGAAAGNAGFADALRTYTNTPASIANLVQMVKENTGQQSLQAVEETLRKQLDGILAFLSFEYTHTTLSDSNIKNIIAQRAIERLQNCNPSLNQLRRLCTNARLRVAGLDDLPGFLTAQLRTTASHTMQAERRNLLQAHSCAARGVACLLSRALQASMANVDSKAALLVYLRDDDRWQQQLVSRLIEEMEREATYSIVEGCAFDADIEKRLFAALRGELVQAEQRFPKPGHRHQFWEVLRTAIVKTLQEVRDILPGLLDNGLKVYLQGLFTALSQDVRTRSHQIFKMENRPRENIKGRLAERRARQPCLWRCIHRFFVAAVGAAEGQGADDREAAAERQGRVQQLRDDLQKLDKRLERAAQAFAPAVMELQAALGNTMAHQALQRARESQVLELRSEIVKPVGFCAISMDGISYFINCAVHSGMVDLPTSLLETERPALQQMLNFLAVHSLYFREDCIPAFGPNSALEGGYAAMSRTIAHERGQGKLRNLVAFELNSNPEELAQDLIRVHGETSPAQYLGRLVGERQERWTSLLELKGLASALETNFIVFTTQLNPGTMSGRMIAYFIGANPLPNVSCRYDLVAYPLALCMRAEKGVLRPWFVPLFQDRQKSRELEGTASGSGDASGSSNAGLCGSAQHVRRALMAMADLAARSRPARGPAGRPAPKRPRRSTD